ncbi:hypothetical protein QFE97_02975 [Bacillus subtilis]|nr:hypothetical protein QFE97_02975 [Bacillus subtilis]
MLELVGEVGECVEAGGCDDVELGLLGHPLDPGDVATETHDRRVEDRVDPRGFEVIELGDGIGDLLLVVPGRVIVLPHLLAEDEDVLVDEGSAEFAAVDGAGDGLDFCHGCRSFA